MSNDVQNNVLSLGVLSLERIFASFSQSTQSAQTTFLNKTDVILKLVHDSVVNVIEFWSKELFFTVFEKVSQTSQSVGNNSWDLILQIRKDNFQNLLVVFLYKETELIIGELSNSVANCVSNSWVLMFGLLHEKLHKLIHLLNFCLVWVRNILLDIVVLSDLGNDHDGRVE